MVFRVAVIGQGPLGDVRFRPAIHRWRCPSPQDERAIGSELARCECWG